MFLFTFVIWCCGVLFCSALSLLAVCCCFVCVCVSVCIVFLWLQWPLTSAFHLVCVWPLGCQTVSDPSVVWLREECFSARCVNTVGVCITSLLLCVWLVGCQRRAVVSTSSLAFVRFGKRLIMMVRASFWKRTSPLTLPGLSTVRLLQLPFLPLGANE